MNTEARLRDALHTAAHTIESPPPFPTRRSAFPRPLAAAVAVAAVLGGIAFLATDHFLIPSPTSSQVLSPPAPQKIAVYLCIRRSSNDACRGDATERQRQAIADRLRSLPEVRTVTYESRKEAYERFRELFEDTPGFIAATRPGDVPDSFRLEAAPDSLPAIGSALDDLSGIDQIVAEPVETP